MARLRFRYILCEISDNISQEDIEEALRLMEKT